jgi:hypothetical protein
VSGWTSDSTRQKKRGSALPRSFPVWNCRPGFGSGCGKSRGRNWNGKGDPFRSYRRDHRDAGNVVSPVAQSPPFLKTGCDVATVYTFDILTDRDYFDRMLTPTITDYRKDQLSVLKAMTSSIFLLQFTDWVYHCNPVVVADLLGSAGDERALTAFFSSQWECYHTIRCIATGTKHYNVTNRQISNVVDTKLQHGFYSPLGFTLTESHLTMKTTDGGLRFVDYDILNCYDKWIDFVSSTLNWSL